MADISQQWARDPEIAGTGGPHYTNPAGSSEEYSDTDRFGKTIIANRTKPIQSPQNKVSDPVWGVNDYAGGIKECEAPEIPVTKGQ